MKEPRAKPKGSEGERKPQKDDGPHCTCPVKLEALNSFAHGYDPLLPYLNISLFCHQASKEHAVPPFPLAEAHLCT